MIERRAIGDDADRRAQRVVQIGAFDRDHRIAPRQRKACEIAEEVRQPRKLRPGLVQRAAVVERFEPVELLQVGLERVGELVHQPRPRADVHAAPGLAFEGCARALHRAVDILWRRVRDLCDHLAGGGIADVEHLATAGLDLAAVDIVAVHLDVAGRGSCRNVHASLPSTMTALRFSAGNTRLSVWVIWALMMRAALRRSRHCIASIRATCSATSSAGLWSPTLVTLTRTRRSACPIKSHSACAMRRLPEACASAQWKSRL